MGEYRVNSRGLGEVLAVVKAAKMICTKSSRTLYGWFDLAANNFEHEAASPEKYVLREDTREEEEANRAC
jgi:hypothetical protein